MRTKRNFQGRRERLSRLQEMDRLKNRIEYLKKSRAKPQPKDLAEITQAEFELMRLESAQPISSVWIMPKGAFITQYNRLVREFHDQLIMNHRDAEFVLQEFKAFMKGK